MQLHRGATPWPPKCDRRKKFFEDYGRNNLRADYRSNYLRGNQTYFPLVRPHLAGGF